MPVVAKNRAQARSQAWAGIRDHPSIQGLRLFRSSVRRSADTPDLWGVRFLLVEPGWSPFPKETA